MCLRVFQGQGHKDPRTYEHKERVIDVCWDNFFSLIRTGEQAHLVRKQGRREFWHRAKAQACVREFWHRASKARAQACLRLRVKGLHAPHLHRNSARRSTCTWPAPSSHSLTRNKKTQRENFGASRRCLHLLPSSACMCKLTTTHCHDRMTVLIRPHVRPHVSAVKRLRTARASAAKQTRGLRIPKSCALDTAA